MVAAVKLIQKPEMSGTCRRLSIHQRGILCTERLSRKVGLLCWEIPSRRIIYCCLDTQCLSTQAIHLKSLQGFCGREACDLPCLTRKLIFPHYSPVQFQRLLRKWTSYRLLFFSLAFNPFSLGDYQKGTPDYTIHRGKMPLLLLQDWGCAKLFSPRECIDSQKPE